MMRWTLALLLILLAGGAASAQEATPTQVGRAGCTALDDEDVLICPVETIVNQNGSFPGIAIYVREAGGLWVQLTPCDDIAVRCEIVRPRAEGLVQGESIGIVLDAAPGDG